MLAENNLDYCAVKIALIAIHGTFANNATWIESESPIMRKVVSSVGECGSACDVLPFRWSGANRISAREEAANDLCEMVRKLTDEAQYDRIYVIAHSHGGNVIAHAAMNFEEFTR